MAATVPVTAYYGEASSYIKHELHPIDWQHAMTRPDAARWSLSAQSGAIIDKTHNRNVALLSKRFRGFRGPVPAAIALSAGRSLPPGQHLVILASGHMLTLLQFRRHLEAQKATARKYEQLTDLQRVYGMHA